jgi:hypothetical protein
MVKSNQELTRKKTTGYIAMEDNMQNLNGTSPESLDIPEIAPLKKKKSVGGIVMGIINIVMSAPVAVLFFITVASMLVGAAIISNPDISVDGADNMLEAILLGLLQMLLLVYAIGLSFAFAIGGSIATVIASIPSFIFFIVARFNRSKFFKITSVLVSLMAAAACIIVIGACVFFVLAANTV